jgi:hypothetical protein
MKVITSDNVTMEFDHSQSQVLKDLIDDTSADVVPVPFDSATVAKLAHWMTVSDDPEEPWETLKAMAQATDFLNMPELMDRTCRRMANELKGRPPEQIRKMMS